MKKKQIILVTGATGAQGGSVARALLAENKFAVRILTRNPLSEKAKALRRAGAEIVKGDFDDRESLIRAMKNCYAVFGVTNFWEHFAREYQQGINLIDAVCLSGIKHFVFHSLPDYYRLSRGKYSVPHCDIKAKLQEYAQQLKLPATFIHIAFYYENFFSSFPLQPSETGGYSFGFPQGDTKLAMASVEDMGGVVASVFNNPGEYIGKTVGVVGADDSCGNYAAQLSRLLGQDIQYSYIPREVYADFGFPGAYELASMFEVQRLHIPERQTDLELSYRLNPAMQNFESWIVKNKVKFETYFKSIAPQRLAV